jgi:hypothetical protein
MYKGEPLMLGFRADIPEFKAVPTLLSAHDMQLQTYLRMSGLPVGLLFNFHALRWVMALRRETGLSSPWPTVALLLPPCSRIPGLTPTQAANGETPGRHTTIMSCAPNPSNAQGMCGRPHANRRA